MFLMEPPGVEPLTSEVMDRIMTEDEIIDLLAKQNVLFQDWGKREGTRTLAKFCEYHSKDQFYITPNLEGGVIINVHAAIVMVYHNDLELFEEKQIDARGHETSRPDFDGVAETLHRLEHHRIGAFRCLKEELKFEDPSKFDMSACVGLKIEVKSDSEKWPRSGVKPIFHRYIHISEISDEIFRPDGYVEVEKDGRRIYFKWRRKRPLSFSF
jgi:hypothetical protein